MVPNTSFYLNLQFWLWVLFLQWPKKEYNNIFYYLNPRNQYHVATHYKQYLQFAKVPIPSFFPDLSRAKTEHVNSVHTPFPFYWGRGLSLWPNFQKGELHRIRILIFRGVCWERGGDFFQEEESQILHKK